MIIIVFMLCGLGGFLIGLSLAGRIAEHKLEEMRLEAGLSMDPENYTDYLEDWDEIFKG